MSDYPDIKELLQRVEAGELPARRTAAQIFADLWVALAGENSPEAVIRKLDQFALPGESSLKTLERLLAEHGLPRLPPAE